MLRNIKDRVINKSQSSSSLSSSSHNVFQEAAVSTGMGKAVAVQENSAEVIYGADADMVSVGGDGNDITSRTVTSF